MTEDNEEARSVFTVPNLIKTLVWLIPVVFGAGAIYASVGNTNDKVIAHSKSITEIQTATIQSNQDRVVQRTQIKGLKTSQRSILKEVKEIRTEQRVMQQNMAAVCQATKANCSR